MKSQFGIGLCLLALCAVVHAKPFAVAVSGDGSRLEFHSEPGICVNGARLAENTDARKMKVKGCWIMAGNVIHVAFLDGERATVPADQLQKIVDNKQ